MLSAAAWLRRRWGRADGVRRPAASVEFSAAGGSAGLMAVAAVHSCAASATVDVTPTGPTAVAVLVAVAFVHGGLIFTVHCLVDGPRRPRDLGVSAAAATVWAAGVVAGGAGLFLSTG